MAAAGLPLLFFYLRKGVSWSGTTGILGLGAGFGVGAAVGDLYVAPLEGTKAQQRIKSGTSCCVHFLCCLSHTVHELSAIFVLLFWFLLKFYFFSISFDIYSAIQAHPQTRLHSRTVLFFHIVGAGDLLSLTNFPQLGMSRLTPCLFRRPRSTRACSLRSSSG